MFLNSCKIVNWESSHVVKVFKEWGLPGLARSQCAKFSALRGWLGALPQCHWHWNAIHSESFILPVKSNSYYDTSVLSLLKNLSKTVLSKESILCKKKKKQSDEQHSSIKVEKKKQKSSKNVFTFTVSEILFSNFQSGCHQGMLTLLNKIISKSLETSITYTSSLN